ncbi:MAG TPA: PASTA domain-containing protein, partial [Candidatus Hydrogenedentes bacterium]|nr:PASTA domain-containing protein [Candidatus Hydrogenedentota bacterium]
RTYRSGFFSEWSEPRSFISAAAVEDEGEGEPEGEPAEGEGGEHTIVPDVVGRHIDDAIEAITDAQLKVGSVILVFDNVIPKDYVIGQSPEAGARVTINTGVSLVQSKGSVSSGCGRNLFKKGNVKRFLGDFMLLGLAILTLAGMRRV